MLFMGDAGLRAEEVVNLNWGDMWWNEGGLRVKAGKGNKARTVTVSKYVLNLLREYRDRLPKEATGIKMPVFCNNTGKRMSLSTLQSAIARISDRSKVDFSAHSLRRYAMRTWQLAGRSLEDIRKAAGHSDTVTTYRYIIQFVPVITKGQMKTNGVDYLVANGLIENIRWKIVSAENGERMKDVN